MFEKHNNGFLVARAMERDNLSEGAFHRMISLESRRVRRSRKAFMLMLVEIGALATSKNDDEFCLRKVLSVLSLMLRETDITGWYKEHQVIGVIFTEIPLGYDSSLPATLMTRVNVILKGHLPDHEFQRIMMKFCLLPERQSIEPTPQISRSRAEPAAGAAFDNYQLPD